MFSFEFKTNESRNKTCVDLFYVTDIIFNKSYQIVKNKFNPENYKGLYINPYFQVIEIIKYAKLIIKKINPCDYFINTYFNIYNYKEGNEKHVSQYFQKYYDVIESRKKEYEQTDNEIKNLKKESVKYFKFIFKFNGEYKITEYPYSEFDYQLLTELNKFYKCKSTNEIYNIDDEYYKIDIFKDYSKKLFEHLEKIQSQMPSVIKNEIYNYILHEILRYIDNKTLDKNESINYLVCNNNLKNIFDEGEKNNILTIINENEDKIKFKIGKLKQKFRISYSIPDKIKIVEILELVKKYFGCVININPVSIKEETNFQKTEIFDFIDNYRIYFDIYKFWY